MPVSLYRYFIERPIMVRSDSSIKKEKIIGPKTKGPKKKALEKKEAPEKSLPDSLKKANKICLIAVFILEIYFAVKPAAGILYGLVGSVALTDLLHSLSSSAPNYTDLFLFTFIAVLICLLLELAFDIYAAARSYKIFKGAKKLTLVFGIACLLLNGVIPLFVAGFVAGLAGVKIVSSLGIIPGIILIVLYVLNENPDSLPIKGNNAKITQENNSKKGKSSKPKK